MHIDQTIQYKSYTIRLEHTETPNRNHRVTINSAPIILSKRTKIALSHNDPDIKAAMEKLGKNASIEDLQKTGAEVFKNPHEFLKHIGFSEDDILYMEDRLDKRSRNYLDAVVRNLGVLGTNADLNSGDMFGYKGLEFEKEFQLQVWMNASEVDCGRDKDGNWVAEYCVQTDIDDFCITSIVFNHKPTKKDILIYKAVEDIKFLFSCRGKEPEFTCWECGRKSHWLDIKCCDSLVDRLVYFKDSYCGC